MKRRRQLLGMEFCYVDGSNPLRHGTGNPPYAPGRKPPKTKAKENDTPTYSQGSPETVESLKSGSLYSLA